MISKGKKIILITIGALIVILLGMLGNYYLEEDKPEVETNVAEENNTPSQEQVVKDDNELIHNAQPSEKLNYKDIMPCINQETNKGCVMQNNGNEVVLYNTSVISGGEYETMRVDVYLNGNKLDVYNEPLHSTEITFGTLTDTGLFLVKSGTLPCNQELYVFDVTGKSVTFDIGNFNLCKVSSENNTVTLNLDHKTIWSKDNYICGEKDKNYMQVNGDIDVKLTYQASVSNGQMKFTTMSNEKYSAFCNANGGA